MFNIVLYILGVWQNLFSLAAVTSAASQPRALCPTACQNLIKILFHVCHVKIYFTSIGIKIKDTAKYPIKCVCHYFIIIITGC